MTAGGFSKARLGRLHDVMSGHVERGEVPGLVTLVSRRGEAHVDVDTGFSVPAAKLGRLATSYWTNFETGVFEVFDEAAGGQWRPGQDRSGIRETGPFPPGPGFGRLAVKVHVGLTGDLFDGSGRIIGNPCL